MSKKNFRLGPKAVHFAWRVLLREDPDFGFYRRAEAQKDGETVAKSWTAK